MMICWLPSRNVTKQRIKRIEETMKVNLYADITRSRRTGDWTCLLLPTIAIKREDVYDDEAVHYVILHWLIFQVYVRIITQKL